MPCHRPTDTTEPLRSRTGWTPEEVANAWRTGDRHFIAECYVYLVHKVFKAIGRDVKREADRQDLLQEGVLALLKAIDDFDYTRNVKFPTYAIYRVRGAMLDWLRKHADVSRAAIERYNQKEKAAERLTVRGEAPTDTAIAEEMGLSLDEFYALYPKTARRTIRWSEMAGSPDRQGTGEGEAPEHRIPDTAPAVADVAVGSTFTSEVMRLTLLLPAEERAVILHRYRDGMEWRDIAAEIGKKSGEVQHIHRQAVRRLRELAGGDR